MPRKGVTFLALLLAGILLVLVSGCGSGTHKGAAPGSTPPTTPDPSGSQSSTWPPAQHPGAPNTCSLLDNQTAGTLAGAKVGLVGGDPADDWPNIICEYATTYESAGGAADVSLVATSLQIDGRPYTPAQWTQLVGTINHRDLSVTTIPALTSPGYYGWAFGPTLLERSSNETYIGNCGFAKNGYGYYFGGQWSDGLTPPSQSSMVELCEKIASEI